MIIPNFIQSSEELETNYYNFDKTYYYFKAKANGLSYFAIGTKTPSPTQTETPVEYEDEVTVVDETGDASANEDSQETTSTNQELEFDPAAPVETKSTSAIWIILLLIIIATGVAGYMKYGKEKLEKKLFKNA